MSKLSRDKETAFLLANSAIMLTECDPEAVGFILEAHRLIMRLIVRKVSNPRLIRPPWYVVDLPGVWGKDGLGFPTREDAEVEVIRRAIENAKT